MAPLLNGAREDLSDLEDDLLIKYMRGRELGMEKGGRGIGRCYEHKDSVTLLSDVREGNAATRA